MNAKSPMRTAPSINGHMIALGTGHSIAIYERNGFSYVAEFRNGRGEFTYAGAWFRTYAGGLRYCHNRRTAFQVSMPLSPDMLANIERLHAEDEARHERMLAVPGEVATIVKRFLLSLMSWTRGASKTSRTVG